MQNYIIQLDDEKTKSLGNDTEVAEPEVDGTSGGLMSFAKRTGERVLSGIIVGLAVKFAGDKLIPHRVVHKVDQRDVRTFAEMVTKGADTVDQVAAQSNAAPQEA